MNKAWPFTLGFFMALTVGAADYQRDIKPVL